VASRGAASTESVARGKKKLSYLEAREYDSIEAQVAAAEEVLQAKRMQVEDPAIASNGPRLVTAHAELEAAQDKVDTLYARWAELEAKKA
jgi:ATP-binding cassette subfamily F protein uup